MTARAGVSEGRIREIRALLTRDPPVYLHAEMRDLWLAAAHALAALDQARAEAVTLREIAVNETIERAEQACRYALKHQDFMGAEPAYKEAWEVAASVCEKAIRSHVERHIQQDVERALAAARGRENPEAFVEAYDRAVRGNGDWS